MNSLSFPSRKFEVGRIGNCLLEQQLGFLSLTSRVAFAFCYGKGIDFRLNLTHVGVPVEH